MKKLGDRLQFFSVRFLILWVSTTMYGQLTPSQDSYTNAADPTTNYGAKTLLDVESSQTTYIQFNLSSIPATYSSADITKATLKLYVNTVTTAGSFNVDYVNGTWAESTIDASNAPAIGTTIAASVPLVTADKNQFILVDVTAAVQAWLSGTANDGVALVGNSPVNATFDSKESTTTSHAAELDIVFAGGGTITGITTASGSGLTGGGTSGSLNLALTNACAANQVLQWNGSSWICAAVGTGTITGVTAGTDLTGGGSSGNVTLNLNTTALNATYAQLAAANTFTGNQTVNGSLGVTSAGTTVASVTTGAGQVAVSGLAKSTSSNGVGVAGIGEASGGAGVGGASPNLGVYGISNGGSAQGEGSGKAGVWGDAGGSSGAGYYGVLGTADANSAGGFYNNGAYPTLVAKNNAASATNVIAIEGQSSNVGVYGNTSGASGLTAGSGIGVWGDAGGTANDAYYGILGTANENFAGVFINNSSTTQTLFAQNNAESSSTATVFETYSFPFGGSCTINVSGVMACNGGFTNEVDVDGGARKVALHSVQSPEIWFEDFGSGTLNNGAATVTLEPTFAQTVNTGTEYHVFLTPNGDSKGLYVSQKTPTSFEVREQGSGTSNIAFDYRIVAKGVGSENLRLEDLTEQFKQREAQHKKMQIRVHPSAAPLTSPKVAKPSPALRPATMPGKRDYPERVVIPQ